jgi:hypothetical protein
MAGKTSKASKPQRDKGARPSKFSQEMADAICEQIVLGKSMRQICQQQDMPAERTVYYWLEKDREFCQQYARAREAQADLFFDECLAIANDRTGDYVTAHTEEGKTFERVNHEHIQRSRLRVDTLKWAAGKLAPKKYGEHVTHGFGDQEWPISPRPAVIVTIGGTRPVPAREAGGGVHHGGDRGAVRRGGRGGKADAR